MNWNRFAFILLGVTCVVVGTLVPATATILTPLGYTLVGGAIPSDVASPVVGIFRHGTEK